MRADPVFYQEWMRHYQDLYLHRDIGQLFPRLNKTAFARFLKILGKLSGTILNKRQMAQALEVSEPTVKEYLQIIEGTYLWRNLPSYEGNALKKVIKMSKGMIRDSGLLHYLLNIDSLDQLTQDPRIGVSFEAFVIEEILKGLETCLGVNWSCYYYRSRSGAEIDLILEGSFGVLPIEIKYGTQTHATQLASLKRFLFEKNAPLGIVINRAEKISLLAKNIVQVPIGYL